MSFLEKEAETRGGICQRVRASSPIIVLSLDLMAVLVPAGKLEEPLVVRPTSETIIGAIVRQMDSVVSRLANPDQPVGERCALGDENPHVLADGRVPLAGGPHSTHATEEEAWEETRKMPRRLRGLCRELDGNARHKRRKDSRANDFRVRYRRSRLRRWFRIARHCKQVRHTFSGSKFRPSSRDQISRSKRRRGLCLDNELGSCRHASFGALIMSHSDDDGLILPPRLAPKHVVLLPIYRSDDDDRAKVLEYCASLQQQLEAQSYAGSPVRVMLDDRDLRGGEKNWQHVKRGVPLRAEVGPKDLANDAVFLARRDSTDKQSVPRQQLVETIGDLLEEIQTGLFDRALQLRQDNSTSLDTLDEFKEYFTPQNANKPEIHGGFAHCHFVDDPSIEATLKAMKVTVRCIPLESEGRAG